MSRSRRAPRPIAEAMARLVADGGAPDRAPTTTIEREARAATSTSRIDYRRPPRAGWEGGKRG